MADRRGLLLRKSGRRDAGALDFGKYMLVDPLTNEPVAGVSQLGRPELTMDDVEDYLTTEHTDAEVEDTLPDEGPAHYLPDVVAEDALENLRTQAMHWFEQGGRLERLMEDGVVMEPRSREDKAALKRATGKMARIARRLKEAF